MKFKIKIWHIIAGLLILIAVIRAGVLIDAFSIIPSAIILLFEDPGFLFEQSDFALLDLIASCVLLPVAVFFVIKCRKKISFLENQAGFDSIVLILLCTAYIFAPLIAEDHPDFYKNIGVTRLLAPLSEVTVIHLKAIEKDFNEQRDNFLIKKQTVVKKAFDDNIIFADSIMTGEKVYYYQKGRRTEIEKSALVMLNGKPKTETKVFWLGSDEFGRDIFSRLVYGTRISLSVGILAVLISLIIGLLSGYVAGYKGGVTDVILSRITDMFLAFPVIFLVVLILALFGNNFLSVVVVLGLSTWMSLFRIVKAEVVSIKSRDFFRTAEMIGLPHKDLLIKEILPVIAVPVVVNVVFQYGNVILAESALSYLGLGMGNNHPSWGSMIQSGQEYMQKAWWMILFPGAILIVTLLTANMFGSRINRYFNPRIN